MRITGTEENEGCLPHGSMCLSFMSANLQNVFLLYKKILKNKMKKLRFAIFGNEYQAKKSAAIQKITALLQQKEADVFFDRPFYEFLTKGQHLDVYATSVFDGEDFDADFAVSMGGDGTLLRTASRVSAKDIPIIGINIGRLGFLADVKPVEIELAIEAIYNNRYCTYAHTALLIETDSGSSISGSPFALNDIAVLKRDSASMITINASINDEYLMTYQADGLIVTTPTGSTAYSLSNGGPILTPETGVLCLTAVAPHSLNVRPIVVSDDAVITLKVASRSRNFLVAIDGRSETLSEGTVVTIRKAEYKAKVVRFNHRRYYSTLREKMMWGLDQR